MTLVTTDRTPARCIETGERTVLDYPLDMFELFADDFEEICSIEGGEVVCKTAANMERVKRFVDRNRACQIVKKAARLTLVDAEVDAVCEQAHELSALEMDAFIINKLGEMMGE